MHIALKAIIVWAIGSAFARILMALGLGFATYKGVDKLAEKFFVQFESLLGHLPTSLIQLLRLAEVDTSLSIIFSALLLRIAMDTARVFVGLR